MNCYMMFYEELNDLINYDLFFMIFSEKTRIWNM